MKKVNGPALCVNGKRTAFPGIRHTEQPIASWFLSMCGNFFARRCSVYFMKRALHSLCLHREDRTPTLWGPLNKGSPYYAKSKKAPPPTLDNSATATQHSESDDI